MCGSILRASRCASIDRSSHYVWLGEDASYPARFAEVEKRAARTLEDEAVRRAVEGMRRPVLYKGKQVYVGGMPLYETEYSDRLLERLLAKTNPEGFRRRVENTNLLKIDPDTLTPEQREMIANEYLRHVFGDEPGAGLIAIKAFNADS